MADTFLITGGAGNLACQLTFHLARPGRRVVLLDVAERPVTDVAEGCRYVRGDVARSEDVSAVLREHKPDTIIHFASLLSGKSERDRQSAWRINMQGTFNLFELALEFGVRSVFFPSSVAAYGGRLPNPVPEDLPQWPTGLYGVTKLSVERLGVYYHQCHGLDFRCIRLPVVVSAFAPPGAASAYASRAFVESVRSGRFTFRVRPQTRPSLIYVHDVLRAITDLLQAPADRLTRRVYNVQALSPSAGELERSITDRLPDADVQFDPDQQVVDLIESWPVEFDDASARRDWHWQPRYDLDAMADDFIEQMRAGLTQPAGAAS